MSKSNDVVSQALTRPLHVLALVVGLAVALAGGPWWFFPLSVVPYALMVVLSLRDPRFVEASLARSSAKQVTREAIRWGPLLRVTTNPARLELIRRLARSESKLATEVAGAPAESRPILDACLAQVRSAGRIGLALLRRVDEIERAVASGRDPNRMRAEANRLRARAEATADDPSRKDLLAAASAQEESATHTEALLTMRDRTLAQLENLAASLESASVRAVRLRIATGDEGGSAGDVADALRIDVDAMRETLSAFEGSSDESAFATDMRASERKEAP